MLLGGADADGEIGFNLGGRGGRIYWGNGLVLRRGGAGEDVYVENNNTTGRSRVITEASGDGRYLGLVAGGIVTGPMQLLFNPAVATDAVTKGYVDNRLAAPVLLDIPANVVIAGDDAWHDVVAVRIVIPRLGTSRIAVAVTCNIQDMPSTALGFADVRLAGTAAPPSGTIVRRCWLYGVTPPNVACGFITVLYADVAGGGSMDIPLQVRAVGAGTGAPPSFTIIGGNATVDLRSQILLTDMGPI